MAILIEAPMWLANFFFWRVHVLTIDFLRIEFREKMFQTKIVLRQKGSIQFFLILKMLRRERCAMWPFFFTIHLRWPYEENHRIFNILAVPPTPANRNNANNYRAGFSTSPSAHRWSMESSPSRYSTKICIFLGCLLSEMTYHSFLKLFINPNHQIDIPAKNFYYKVKLASETSSAPYNPWTNTHTVIYEFSEPLPSPCIIILDLRNRILWPWLPPACISIRWCG